MGILSHGEYGAPKDVIFSFPVTIQNGTYNIVQGLALSDFDRERLAITGKELLEERAMALGDAARS
jgi:malate dehydrogenase